MVAAKINEFSNKRPEVTWSPIFPPKVKEKSGDLGFIFTTAEALSLKVKAIKIAKKITLNLLTLILGIDLAQLSWLLQLTFRILSL